MNKSMIRFLLSKLLLIEAALLAIPLTVGLIYREPQSVMMSIVITMIILIILGLLGSLFKPKNYHIYTKEGMLIVALCWILWSFFGALPFVISGQIPNIIDAFFEVSAIITTTGFGVTDITRWPLFSQVILLFLMFIGGSAGSTAGGFKVMRSLSLAKIARNQVLSTLYPNRVMSLHINKSVLDKNTQHGVLKYLTIYLAIFMALVLVLTLDTNDFLVVVSAAASCFNNIGPLLGSNETFSFFSPFSKLLLSFAMIAGRLEIYPVLLMFIPKTWSKL
ncbi:TPA: potassium transporter TrkG [Streptococcus agalactiae]